MEFFLCGRQVLRTHLIFILLLQCIKCQNVSAYDATFDDLCRFEGMCLNCSQGGCEDMCQFYDNNCCDNASSKNTLLEKWQYSCVRKFPDMYELHLDCRGSSKGVLGVYMVTLCSADWTDYLIKRKCENISDEDLLSRIPVYDNMLEKVTYKNMYCAFCNRLSLQRLRFWKFDLMCNNKDSVNQTDNGNGKRYDPWGCFIRFVYRQHRMCAVDVIESCSKNKAINSSLRDRCENGLSQNVYAWIQVNVFNVYKNEFCAQCNDDETKTLQCWPFQAFTCWPLDLPTYTDVNAMISLSLYEKTSTHSMKIINHSTCSDGMLYDPFSKQCLNVTCLPSLNRCISGECHLVQLSDLEFIIQNDSSLLVLDFGEVIQSERYFIGDSNVNVCLNDKQYTEYEIYSRRQTTETEERSTRTLQGEEKSTETLQITNVTSDACAKQIQWSFLAIPFLVTLQ